MLSIRKIFACCAIVAVSTAAGRTSAQATHAPCGSGVYASDYLTEFAKYFRDSAMARVRNDKIRQLTPADTQYVVTNPGICQAVLHAAERRLGTYNAEWPQIERNGFDFTVLRYGEYYAVFVDYPRDPETGQPPHFLPLLVLRARGLEHLITILV
jgi:hypothetical protein